MSGEFEVHKPTLEERSFLLQFEQLITEHKGEYVFYQGSERKFAKTEKERIKFIHESIRSGKGIFYCQVGWRAYHERINSVLGNY